MQEPITSVVWTFNSVMSLLASIAMPSRKFAEAGVKRCTSHEPNGMQMRKALCSPLLALDSAHAKYGV